MASGISNFTSKGTKMPFRQRPVFPNNGGDPKPIRARLNRTDLLTGRKVRVTNPRASFGTRRRTRSLGMGAAGQRNVT